MRLQPFHFTFATAKEHRMIPHLRSAACALTLAASSFFLMPTQLAAHCQVPCGIYDDHARVDAMLEDAATVLKATQKLKELAGTHDPQGQQQIVRWVMNKEKHAQAIIDTISDYFLTQRVNEKQEDYAERLMKHHKVIVAAMKAKQRASHVSAEALSDAIKELIVYYPAPEKHEH
jgi:nickel superoxide dismutase